MKIFLTAIFLATISPSSCNKSANNSIIDKKSIESVTVYPNSTNYSIEQARGIRAIAEMHCKSGADSYCMDLAKMLTSGFGGEKDPKRANLLLKNACKKEYQLACAQIRK